MKEVVSLLIKPNENPIELKVNYEDEFELNRLLACKSTYSIKKVVGEKMYLFTIDNDMETEKSEVVGVDKDNLHYIKGRLLISNLNHKSLSKDDINSLLLNYKSTNSINTTYSVLIFKND